jgi:hypothetical protein
MLLFQGCVCTKKENMMHPGQNDHQTLESISSSICCGNKFTAFYSILSTALCQLKQNLLSKGKVVSAQTMMVYKGTAPLIPNLRN